VALMVTLVSAVYVGRTVDHQWVPHDEGALAQSAERTMHGELPHRDFDELYTGGLTAVNAVAFRVLGVRLSTLRVVLMIAFVLWVPALYYVASRFAGPVTAVLATGLAVTWSVPNYPAAMPSWYNLFFAVFAIAAVLRFGETGRRRWLVVCGAAAGMSVCTKIIGVYLMMAVLLTLVWHEQTMSTMDPLVDQSGSDRGRAFGVAVTVGLCTMIAALVALVRHTISPPVLAHFVLPSAVLVGVLVAREWSVSRAPSRLRLTHATALVLPTAIGWLVPVVLFVAPYLVTGSMHDLMRGVFITPSRRVQLASLPLPPLDVGWPGLVLAAVLASAVLIPRRWTWLLGVALGIPLGIEVLTWTHHPSLYLATWAAARVAIPLVVVCGSLALILALRRGRLDAVSAERVFALLSVAALCSLVQFPFSASIYFCYVAPLAVLAILAVLAATRDGPDPIAAVVATFFTLFAVVSMNRQSLDTLGRASEVGPPLVPLRLSRAGLSVPVDDADTYERLVAAVVRHAGGSKYAYAAPDCPEVTFLAGLRNPSRTLFDVFDDSTTHRSGVERAVLAHDVRVVALNGDPEFSTPIGAALDSTLRARFPQSDTIDRFTVRWRQ
jgi:hypothetical protein